MEDLIEQYKAKARKGMSMQEALFEFREQGVQILDAIKLIKFVYGVSLGDAKQIVTAHPAWEDIHEANRPLHDAAIAVAEADIWSSIFSRKGAPGELTRLWGNWNDQSRAAALDEINLDEDAELPVVLAKARTGDLMVLTTQRLICSAGTVSVEDIVGVGPTDFTRKRKDQLEALDVELASGQILRLSVEAGPPYFALWNVLLHIARRNARAKTATHF